MLFANRTTIFVQSFILAIIVLLVFSIGAKGEFIFDSLSALDSNPYINGFPKTFSDWYLATWSFEGSQFRRPISMLTFQLNNLLAGDVIHWSTKLTNIFIHIINTWLVYSIFQLALRTPFFRGYEGTYRNLPFFVAIFWAVNPLHVSTVLYAVQRMAQLATMFSLISIFSYLAFRLSGSNHVHSGHSPKKKAASQLVLQIFLFSLAILSKENALILPGLLLLSEWFFFRRFSFSHKSINIMLLVLGLLAISVIAYYWLTSDFTQRYLEAGRDYNATDRLLTQVGLLLRYVYWFLFPNIRNLGMYHDDLQTVTSWSSIDFLLPIGIWLFCFVVAFILRQSFLGAAALFSMLWFLIGHSLEASIWPLEMVFEHRNYLPMVGVAFFSICCVITISSKFSFSQNKRVTRLCAFLLLLPFVFLGFLRSYDWSDQYSLAFLHAENHPESTRSQYHFALVNRILMSKLGPESEGFDLAKGYAYEYTNRVIKMDPEGLYGIATLYLIEGKWNPYLVDHEYYKSEIFQVTSGMRPSPTNINSIGLIKKCVVHEFCQYSEQEFSELIKVAERQTFGRIPYNKLMASFSHQALKDREKAIAYFQSHIDSDPNDFTSRRYLAKLLAQQGDVAEGYQFLFYNLENDALGLERVNLSKWLNVE